MTLVFHWCSHQIGLQCDVRADHIFRYRQIQGLNAGPPAVVCSHYSLRVLTFNNPAGCFDCSEHP